MPCLDIIALPLLTLQITARPDQGKVVCIARLGHCPGLFQGEPLIFRLPLSFSPFLSLSLSVYKHLISLIISPTLNVAITLVYSLFLCH